jgi:hypothetical protein
MKLTLNVDSALIEKIKLIAKKRNTGVSKMVEDFFKKEVEREREPFRMKDIDELPDWVKGLAASKEPIPDFDHKAEFGKHLEEKYGLL